jgi:hypothetical protein
MKSICPVPSYRRISKLRLVLLLKYVALHSILKIRLGQTPLVEVKMPPPVPSVRRSSQCGLINWFIVAVGRQTLEKAVLGLMNCRLPFELTLAVPNWVP